MTDLFDIKFEDFYYGTTVGPLDCWTFRTTLPPKDSWAALLAWLRYTFGPESVLDHERAWDFSLPPWYSPRADLKVEIYFCSKIDAAKFRLFFDTAAPPGMIRANGGVA